MKYFAYFFCLLLFFIESAQAQDTTLQRIRSMKEDTTKCSALIKYAKGVMKTDLQKSEQIYRSVIQLSEKLEAPEWAGYAWMEIGYLNGKQAKDRLAIENYRTAITYFKKAKLEKRIARCLLNIGICSDKIGDMDGSINNTLDAIRVLENTDEKLMLCVGYTSMGIMFTNQYDYTKGEAYFKKAAVIAQQIKDTTRQVMALYGASTSMASNNKFEDAKRYAQKALQIATSSGQDYHFCLANECLAEVSVKMKLAIPTIEYGLKALQYARAAQDKHYELITLVTLSEGYGLANDLSKRLQYLNTAKEISETQGIILQMTDIYRGLSETYASMNKDKEAFAYYKKHIFYRDSLKGERDKNNLTALEARYQATKKEKLLTQQQLAIANKEVELRTSREINVVSIGAAIVALLAATLVFLHYRSRRRLHLQQLQTVQWEKEWQLLRAAMEGEEKERSRIAKDLHDGVAGMLAAAKMQLNSLSIKNNELVETKEFVQAVKLLDDSCQEVRTTSHNLMPEILMQYGLEEAIRRFCQNISNDQVLQVQYAAYGTIGRFTISFELTMYRIVQELLNNIVKHAKATTASVQLSVQDDFLSITIEDNGIGFDKNKSHQSGTGLNSLKRRLQALNGTLEIDAQMEQGVTAFIGIDIQNYKL